MSRATRSSMVDLACQTHDGKVIVVATDTGGGLHYTVRQSGFEDSAHDPSTIAELEGFENWKPVPLDRSTDDPSVRGYETGAMTAHDGSPIIRSRYGSDAVASTAARVKLLSALDHLYLFRVSAGGKLLLDRFVLDGLTNMLVPKLEVRFRRSGRRLEPEGGKKANGGPTTDSLGFRSVDQSLFYEPTQELSFLGTFDINAPWFAVEVLPTAEHDRHRWNFFVYADPDHAGPVPNGTKLRPELRSVSVAASAEGLLDVRDQTTLQPDPDNPGQRAARTVPGIVDRTIRLDGKVANGFDSSLYHNQVERQTPAGPQLLKENTRVMLSVPIDQPGRSHPVVAALSFAVDSVGQLAQIDRAADSDEVLSGNVKQVVLPLTDLENIKPIADRTPPPQGQIVKVSEGQTEQVLITSDNTADNDLADVLAVGQQVRISGTRSFDGIYEASAVTNDGFEIAAAFEPDETAQGHWEVVDDDGGLVFDNMVAGYQRTSTGGLKVTSLSHDIEVGDEIRIAGSVDHDGVYPITKVNDDNSFELDQVWPVGDVVNLSRRPRRGLFFDGTGDYLQVPEINTEPHRPTERLQRTVTAWVQLGEISDEPQTIFATGSGLIHLHVDGAGKLRLDVAMADGHKASVIDRDALSPNRWIHVTAMFDYRGDMDGSTTLTLGRGGRVTATASVAPAKPLHLPLRNLRLDGATALTVATMQPKLPQPTDITMEAWVNTRQRGRGVVASWYRNGSFILALNDSNTSGGSGRVVEWTTGADTLTGTLPVGDNSWHHLSVVQKADGTKSIFVDGKLDVDGAAPPAANALTKAATAAAVTMATDTKDPLWLGYLGAAAAMTKATGRTARSAVHAGGSYVQTSIRGWTSYDRAGTELVNYREALRTDTAVHLRPVGDDNHRIELDFADDKVRRRDFDVVSEFGHIDDVVPINAVNVTAVTCGWGRFSTDYRHEAQAVWEWTAEPVDGERSAGWRQSRASRHDMAKESTKLTRTVAYSQQRGEFYYATLDLQSNEVIVEHEWWDGPNPPQRVRTAYPITAVERTEEFFQTHDGWYARQISTDHGTYDWAGGTSWTFTDADGKAGETLYTEVERSRKMKWISLRPDGGDHTLAFETRSVAAGVATRIVNRIDDEVVTDIGDITSATVHGQDPDQADRFVGSLADVRVWNKARSAAVIAEGITERLAGTERNLIAHWPLTETTGPQLADATKNKAHATPHVPHGLEPAAKPAWAGEPHRMPGERASLDSDGYTESVSMAAAIDGRARPILELDGVDGHVKVGTLDEDLADGYTVAAWARWDSFPNWARVIDFGSGPATNNIILAYDGPRNDLIFWTPDGWVVAGTSLTAGTWMHVAATVDAAGNANLYVDGNLAGSGSVGLPVTGRRTVNYIGRSAVAGDPYFDGAIHDVQFWGRALSAAEVKRYGNVAPKGHENGLLHHWSMRTGTVRGKRRVIDGGLGATRHGELVGGAVVERQDHHLPQTASGELRGQLSEVQYWHVNPSMDDVRASMHDRPTGNEYGLVATWRCGGILTGDQNVETNGVEATRTTPDFGPDALDAVVKGDTYVSAATLARRAAGGRATAYRNDELVAVSQGGRYREVFDFQVQRSDGSSLDAEELVDADERGNPVFRFAYWGQASRTSTERVDFRPDEQLDFVGLGDGWFRAAAVVTIPDGVNLIRSFQLDDVRGLWGEGAEPPEREWTHLAIRKHRLELIGDSISRRCYTDLVELPALADDAAVLEAEIKRLPALERKAADLRLELLRLDEQIALFLDTATYEAERTKLRTRSKELVKLVPDAELARRNHLYDPLNHRMGLFHPGTYKTHLLTITASTDRAWVQAGFATLWDLIPTGTDGEYFVTRASTGHRLTAVGDTGVAMGRGTDARSRWKVTWYPASISTGALAIQSVATGRHLGLSGVHHGHGLRTYGDRRWETSICPLSWSRKRAGYEEDLANLDRNWQGLKAEQASVTERLAWLDGVLADTSAEAEREARARRVELVSDIQSVDLAIGRINGDYVATAKALQSEAQTMGLVAEDSVGLKTYGAVLGFASPLGPVTSSATAEGNVQLTYFDRDGRMRSSDYDATSDTTNATYEQWLPAAVAVAPDLADDASAITLDPASPIKLGEGARTVEAWFQYPLPNDRDSRPRDLAFLTSDATGDEAAIAVAANRRLGTVVGGFFHDAGIELSEAITPGWHHVAVVQAGDAAQFFLDGKPAGHSEADQQADTRSAIVVNGTGGVDVGSTDHDYANGFSMQGWFRADETLQNGAWRPLVDFGENNYGKTVRVWFGGRVSDRDLSFQVGTKEITARGALTPRRWVNVACTARDGVGTIYVNGRLAVRAELPEPASGSRTFGFLGGSRDGQAFTGAMTSVQVWNRELRADEVRQHLHEPPAPDAAGLLHHWPGTVRELGNEAVAKVEDVATGGGADKRAHGAVTGNITSKPLGRIPSNDITTIANRDPGAGGGAPFGRVGEVRVWSTALPPAEIRAHSLLTLTGSEPDLAAYFPLDDILGAEAATADRTGNHLPATLVKATPTARTARIGSPTPAVAAFDGKRTLSVGGVELNNRSFTIEYWLKRFHAGTRDWQIGLGSAWAGNGLHIGFRQSDALAFDFWNNSVEVTNLGDTTNRWIHIAAVYDNDAGKQILYVDGKQVGTRNSAPFTGQGDLNVGGIGYYDAWTTGQMAELRVWDHARSAAQLEQLQHRRATGDEAGLMACLPLDGPALTNRVPGKPAPTSKDLPLFPRTDDLPITPAGSLITAEYSTVGADPADAGAKRAVLRRFHGFIGHRGDAELVADKRIEELVLQWVGNAQFEPTLLGYMEGAPPVPSENLTVNYDYDGATSVELVRSDEVAYSWNRSKDTGSGVDANFFLGVGWSTSAGALFETSVSEGHAGARGNVNEQRRRTESSTIRASSTNEQRDRLDLRGTYETDARFGHLGNRYVPKNVGYALVISGMADVFITKMRRTGRMVAYDVQPMEDLPPDINTITFQMNPSYTLNGSLDGMVGSHAADPRFFDHVPAMRAQYGSRYPASYFNLEQAYDLKTQVDRWDKQRESYFLNFDARETGPGSHSLDNVPDAGDSDSYGQVTVDDGSSDDEADGQEGEAEESKTSSADTRREVTAAYKRRSEKGSRAAKARQSQIVNTFAAYSKQLEAATAFEAWQRRMEGLQIRAAKRNIVNSYVWDADGGMRFEEQSFANTIEHTLGGSFSYNASRGLDLNVAVAGLKFELQAMATLELTQSMTKTRSATRSFDLNVRLDGVERKGVTDADDYPVLPGEKVDRYRFMSFYLEGDTNHFNDFFAYVVDPEWLMSNDEEAKALRQVAQGRPNKAWRVMHRVTYVERPALVGFGRDLRQTDELAQSSQDVFNYFDAIEQGNDDIQLRIDELAEQLDSLTTTLASVKDQTDKIAAKGSAPENDDSTGPGPDGIGANEGTAGEIAALANAGPEVLDVNTATADELVAVNGIGPALAKAIIDLRANRGGFSTLEEVADVDGVSTALLLGAEPSLFVEADGGNGAEVAGPEANGTETVISLTDGAELETRGG